MFVYTTKWKYVAIQQCNKRTKQRSNPPPPEYYTFACKANECNDENDDDSASIPQHKYCSTVKPLLKLPVSRLSSSQSSIPLFCALSQLLQVVIETNVCCLFLRPATLANKGNWRTSKSRT